ncbi:sensor domain-containing protein [Vulcaniibacterium gelatinicum]|uniref:sensor domain-containing protein n=1 Tax=Vulcaniibacterium gelatinicum TaxID=2598725 RepID=UPI0011C7F95B|nr:EAL domain-containing protein [Vulcaniibacterium gelatinicum]
MPSDDSSTGSTSAGQRLPPWVWGAAVAVLLLECCALAIWWNGRGGETATAWVHAFVLVVAGGGSVGTVLGAWLLRHAHRQRQAIRRLERERDHARGVSAVRLRQVQAAAAIGEWDWDLEAGTIAWSEEMFRIYGCDPATFRPDPETVFACIHPDDRDRVRGFARALTETGEPCHAEFRIVRPDGSVRMVDARGVLQRDAAGRPCIRSLQQDITERALAEERFRLVARAASEGIWDWDLASDRIWRSDGFFARFGYREDEITPDHAGWRQCVHPDDRIEVESTLAAALLPTGPDQWQARYRFRHGDGSWRDVLDHGFVLRDGRRRTVRVVGSMLDVTERNRAEAELHLLQRMVESSVTGIVIADASAPDLPIVYVNPAFERITGYRAAEALGRNCRFLQDEPRDEAALAAIRSALREARPAQVVLRNRRRDGSHFWNELTISPVHDAAGRVTHFVGVQNDVTARYQLESQLAYAVSHDPLTALPNRAALHEHLTRLAADPALEPGSAALLFLDLDHFKLINEGIGHAAGDMVLLEVAHRLRAVTRAGDLIARFGGDEFVAVLLPRPGGHLDVEAVLRRIGAALQPPIMLGGGAHQITASIGHVPFPDGSRRPESLLTCAELAMYQAKQLGRNRAVAYDPRFDTDVSRRLTLLSQIREALRLEQFELHFQPVVSAGDGALRGLEALLRWRHPERGLLAPGEFIGECEHSGLIVPLGRWILLEAARVAAELRQDGRLPPEVRLSVNVSALQLQPSLLEDVAEAVRQPGFAPEQLELELTESSLVDNPEQAIEVMRGLRELGVQIAIDDFGTGYSSLAYLKRLPITRLKIDRSFVAGLPDEAEDMEICRSILRLAGSLALGSVAEGVESPQQRAWLAAEGCEDVQGYLFARPMPLQALAAWLDARRT